MATGSVVKISRNTGKMPVPPGQRTGPQAGTPAPPGQSTGKMPVPPGQGAPGQEQLEKALKEFNLPDDEGLLIGWTQDRFADGAKSFFLAGLGLIKLHGRARGPNTYSVTDTKTFSCLIDQNFPGLSLRTAENYMAYARAMLGHPAFEAFQKERGGYSKALTALSICSEAEIQEADETGEIYGYTMGRLAKMSVRTMQKALLRAREKEAASVRRETAKAAGEIAELRDQVRDLAAQVPAATPADAAMALIKRAEEKVLDGFRMLANVERQTLVDSPVVRDAIFGLIALGYRVLQNLETETCLAIPEAAAREEGEDGN